jgi:hypothetical protein
MKKINVLFIAMAVMAIAACTSTPPEQQTVGIASNAPAWTGEIAPEDAFWGIGLARLQNQSLGLQTATSRARRDIAEQVSVLVQGMLTDYANESGLSNNPRSTVSIENIGRDIINLQLSGAQPNAREQMPDGTWWVRVAYRKADTIRDVNNIVNHEMADFAEFQAERALRMLDTQLDRSQSRPTPRSTD